MPDETSVTHWYALRVFHNKIRAVKSRIDLAGAETYYPMRTVDRGERGRLQEPLIPSLLFIRAASDFIRHMQKDPTSYAGVYCYPGTSTPAVISDREMEIFRFVTTVGSDRLEVVDPSLAQGDRIRVTQGMFKGAEGYISRVKNAKRLIVVIEGVAAVATTYIPKDYVEKIG